MANELRDAVNYSNRGSITIIWLEKFLKVSFIFIVRLIRYFVIRFLRQDFLCRSVFLGMRNILNHKGVLLLMSLKMIVTVLFQKDISFTSEFR